MPFALLIRDASMPESRDLDGTALMSDDDFRAFYERTARPLWSYLSRITGDRQRSDDLLQETYYRFYRASARYEDESHRRNALFRIATNLVRDEARRARIVQNVPLDDDAQHTRSGATRPDDHATIRTDVARALERLEPAQRELLWLAYAQGASHEEIAGILGLRAVSIRTLLLRARRKFAALLGGAAAEARR